MPLRYRCGQEVLKGDRVRLDGADGVIDFVADPDNPTTDTAWYIQEYGGGVMILDSAIGNVFVDKPEEDDCLQFIRRADG